MYIVKIDMEESESDEVTGEREVSDELPPGKKVRKEMIKTNEESSHSSDEDEEEY